MAARYFKQVSKFGAMMDMLTDRMGTCVLYIIISHLYAGTWGIAAFLIVLDTVSHWAQMYVTSTQGKTTHKGSSNALLNYYYTGKHVLLVLCCGNELFIMCVYYLAFHQPLVVQAMAAVSFPIFCVKQFMNLVQLLHNVHQLVLMDVAPVKNA
jgi:CDP-diacylglycerol--inositol 3-phosphatidyltransferase